MKYSFCLKLFAVLFCLFSLNSKATTNGDDQLFGFLEQIKSLSVDDYEALPDLMKSILTTAETEKDPGHKALLKLAAAELGFAFRDVKKLRDNYYERELETNKSFDDLRTEILNLLDEAITEAPDSPLIGYEKSIDRNAIGSSVVQTVRDFVINEALRLYHYQWGSLWLSDEKIKKYKSQLSESPKPGTPMYFLLKSENLDNYNDREKFEEMLEMCQNPSAAYALYRFITKLPYRERLKDSEIEAELRFLERAKSNVSGLWVEETVDQRINYLHKPYFSFSCRENVIDGNLTPLTLTGYNVDSISINIYYYPDYEEAYERRNIKSEHLDNPFLNKIVRFTNTPLGDNQSVELNLPGGYYVVKPADDFEIVSKKYNFFPLITVTPWAIGLLNEGKYGALQVLGINSSEPVPGLQTIIQQDDENVETDIFTDKNGCVFLDHPIGDFEVSFRDPQTGLTVAYPYELRNWEKEKAATKIKHYQITTDFSAYSPGQEVKLLLTAFNNEKTLAGEKLDVVLELPKSNDENCPDSLIVSFGKTDKFGRSVAHCIIPASSSTGRVRIVNKETGSYLNDITISELKISDRLDFSNIATEFNNDSIIVRGEVRNGDRMGVREVQLQGRIAKKDTEDHALQNIRKGFTDFDGKFSFSFPRFSVNDEAETDEQTISLEILSDEGDYGRELYFNTRYPYELSVYDPSRIFSNPNGSNNWGSRKFLSEFNKEKDIELEVCVQDYYDPIDIIWTLKNIENDSILITGLSKTGKVVIPSYSLKALPVGTYSFVVTHPDGLAEPERLYPDIKLYDLSSQEIPTDKPFFVPERELEGEETVVTVGVTKDNTPLWIDYNILKDKNKSDGLEFHRLNRGWHKIPLKIGKLPEGRTAAEITLYSFDDRHKTFRAEILVSKIPRDSLTLTCESFRDNLIPGSTETWTFTTRKNGEPVSAALYLNMIDLKIHEHENVLTPKIRPFYTTKPLLESYTGYHSKDFYPSYYFMKMEKFSPFSQKTEFLPTVKLPMWRNLYDLENISYSAPDTTFFSMVQEALEPHMFEEYRGKIGYSMTRTNILPTISDSPKATRKMVQNKIGRDINGKINILSGLWEPLLTTDRHGRSTVSFKVPEETKLWYLVAEAWTEDLLSAKLERSFTSDKPLLVTPLIPKTVRSGKEVELVSRIHNNTDAEMAVTVIVTIENTSGVIKDETRTVTLKADEEVKIKTSVLPDGKDSTLFYTVKATNGIYSDGERDAIKVQP